MYTPKFTPGFNRVTEESSLKDSVAHIADKIQLNGEMIQPLQDIIQAVEVESQSLIGRQAVKAR